MTQTGPLGSHPRQLGLIGHPVGHSVSPQMHNAAFAQQRMNCQYTAWAVEPASLKDAVAGIRALGILGVNVTIPHKEAVIPLLDEVAPTAAQVGAVNTIVNRGGRLMGYNTDGWGFQSSLEEAGVKLPGLEVVVLGAGGAARAIALGLARSRVARVVISNRTPERAERLAADISALVPEVPVSAVEALSQEERSALIDAGLVVNCTPLGMAGAGAGLSAVSDINLLPQLAVVYDTVYTPQETRLLKEARQRGLRTVGGLGMLVHQGACAWEYWFGRRGPVSVMTEAAKAALGGGA
ncbi:MAG: shikimate 5-dehydrogenase [Symbiobacteriaceae bacterium]|jgi:shikimate dehydrogenase|nr:shikimate 5-dehydrogenase [Symbiobacteriaceae bacterium]